MTTGAPLTLWCLPNAGASACALAAWRRGMPAGIALQPLELPGRGMRVDEPLIDDFDTLCDSLYQSLRTATVAGRLPGNTPPRLALFGHSMGALLAFELAHRLRDDGNPPHALLVSGSPAPRLRDTRRFADPLDDATLMRQLAELGGTPSALLADAELMRMTLPILRADFRVCGSYRQRDRAPLPCPIHAFGGRADTTVGNGICAWRDETSGGFTLDWYDGGHFFLHTHAKAMQARIAALLSGVAGSALAA